MTTTEAEDLISGAQQLVENTEKDLKISGLVDAIERKENVFIILGEAQRLLRRVSNRNTAKEFTDHLMTSGYDYDQVLKIISRVFDL